ncbi:MAG: hypothetical protein ACOYOO_03610 [Saprospiraceae bacterium]
MKITCLSREYPAPVGGKRLFTPPLAIARIVGTVALLLLIATNGKGQGRGQCLPAVNRYYGYSFMHPFMASPSLPGVPQILGFEEIYQRFGKQEKVQADENVREWRARYCDIPKEEDVREVIYGYDSMALPNIRTAIVYKSTAFGQQNSFAKYLVRHKCIETVDYLIFAKKCEPYATLENNPWDSKNDTGDKQTMDDLIDAGIEAFNDTRSDYIRLRYAFQIIRMAHYSGQYHRTIELYDSLMPKIDHDPSAIEFWILGHKAGALNKIGRNVEAAYLYARVFLNCPGKRESAYRSFRIKTDEEWEKCLLLCQDDRERATLYALRAYAPDSKPLQDMEEIYRLDPQSPYLEVLLAREIKKFEKQLLGLEFNPRKNENQRYHKIPEKNIREQLIAMQAFTRKVAGENRNANPCFWVVGLGYLQLIAGDAYSAKINFSHSKDLCGDDVLLEQAEALETVATILSFEAPTYAVEEIAADIRLKNPLYQKYRSFTNFLNDRISWLYQKFNRPGKAFLVKAPLSDLYLNPQAPLIEDLIQLAESGEPNRFERELLRKTDNLNLANDLINLKATHQFAIGQLDSALATYKQMDRLAWDDYGRFNPFVERFRECINCPVRDTSAGYTRGELIEKILDLEYRAKTDRIEGPKYFYQLGLAYYNMSYFGYAWKTLDFFRSGISLKRSRSPKDKLVVSDNRFALGNRENFDCRRALDCFELARQLTSDPELAARATFMAARCEQNLFFAGFGPRSNEYFELLKRNYAQTRFYTYVVQECSYFKVYARN